MINRVNYFLPLDIVVTPYYSFIYPFISYCGSVWGDTYPSVTNKLKSAQEPCRQSSFSAAPTISNPRLILQLVIIPFKQIFKKLNLSLAHSAYHRNLPPQLLS